MEMRCLVVVATALAGCGGLNLTCQTQTCTGESSKTYEVCAGVGTSGSQVEDKFGGETCSCTATNTSACEQCTQRVAVYCGNVTDGGLGTDMVMHPCSMSVTGAVSTTASCIATTVYADGSNLGGPTLTVLSGGTISLEATLTRPGMVTSGTWSSSDTGAKGVIEVNTGIDTWLACEGCSSPQGSYSMNLTVESMSSVDSGDVYIATGTISATIMPVTGTGASGTINFSASF